MSTESLTKIAPFHDGGDAKVSLEASPSTVCTIHLALTWPRLAAFADPNPPPQEWRRHNQIVPTTSLTCRSSGAAPTPVLKRMVVSAAASGGKPRGAEPFRSDALHL